MSRAYIVKTFCICVAGISPSISVAEYILYSGRSLDTDISPPFMPSSRDECTHYQDAMSEVIQVLLEDHGHCLSNAPSDYGKHRGKCTKSACEQLHVLKDKLINEKSENSTQCLAVVNHREALRIVSDSFSKSSGSSSESQASSSLPVARPTRVLQQQAKDAGKIAEKCDDLRNTTDRKQCYRQVHEYAKNSRHEVPASPVVKSIQDDSFSRIKDVHESALDDLDEVFDKFNTDDGDWDDDWD